jgi:hypothetical protein
MTGMIKTLFEGQEHKITTDGKAFFIYTKISGREWELRDTNCMNSSLYEEALKDLQELFGMKMPEEEKIIRLLQTGFFNVSNL